MTTNFFSNKVAIVTGASSGIGRATALALARQGASVALAARRGDALHELAEEIKHQGGSALAVPTDVTVKEQVEQMVRVVVERWRRVDILVVNAGAYVRGLIVDLSPDEIQAKIHRTTGFWRVQKWLVIWHATVDPAPAQTIALHTGLAVQTVHNLLASYNRYGPAVVEGTGKGGRRRAYLSRGEEVRFL